jgi:hypothetical protein
MIEELTAGVLGLILLIFAFNRLKPVLFSRSKGQLPSWYLILGYLAIVSTTFSRAYGISLSNQTIRFWGALVSGSLTIVFFSFWSAYQLHWSRPRRRSVLILTLLGATIFALGALKKNHVIQSIGLIIFSSISLFVLIVLLQHVIRTTPYLRAQRRVKITTFGLVSMVLFEMLGVFFMQFGFWTSSAIIFLGRDLGWIVLTLGIVFPKWVNELMKKRISPFQRDQIPVTL